MPDWIYLDHAATSPLRPEALAAMQPFLTEEFCNPSSIYRPAQRARSALDAARDSMAALLGVNAAEITFTSGGTESNNAAIRGAALAQGRRGGHIVTTAIEHHAVLEPAQELRDLFGFRVTMLPVDGRGLVDPDEVARALMPDTALVSVMWANNEIGTIQHVAEIAAITRARGIPLHTDAVQAAGALDLAHPPADLITLSAHKFYGPKGAGALVIRGGTPWRPLLVGGGQERERRSGTENVAAIVGMARAFELALAEREEIAARVRRLRDRLLGAVRERIPGVRVNGDLVHRLPGNLNISFDGVSGESLLMGLDLAGIMASSGSACSSGSLDPSHVLLAIGCSEDQARSSLRLTLGRDTTQADVDRTVDVLEQLVTRLRCTAAVAAGR